jgi:hypothetical protein
MIFTIWGENSLRPCNKIKILQCIFLLSLFALFLTPVALVQAGERQPTTLSAGQALYVPAYSHIYHGNQEKPLLLSVTLSLRNIDRKNSISITTIDYFDTAGKLIKHYLDAPVVLGPLGSTRYIVAERDTLGGSGANFIVEWKSDKPVNPPIAETVMIGTQSQLGISFTSRGVVIND